MTVRSPVAEQLDLEPHPEGGWYRQTWRSPVTFLPEGYPGQRCAATAIYFLLHPGEVSRWHVVRSDELWLWHSGGPLELRLGGTGGEPANPDVVLLGNDLDAGPAAADSGALFSLIARFAVFAFTGALCRRMCPRPVCL